METFVRRLGKRHWHLALLVMLLSVAGLDAPDRKGPTGKRECEWRRQGSKRRCNRKCAG